ncbi:ferritin-like domain-containing protein [Nannocystaceae bacterium ST9]
MLRSMGFWCPRHDGVRRTDTNQLAGGDLRAISGDFAVGRGGLIVDMTDSEGPVEIDSDPARGDLFGVLSIPSEGGIYAIAVGVAGRLTSVAIETYIEDKPGCEGITPGRPLRIAGQARLAGARERGDWSQATTPWIESMSDELRERLAALWTRDALLEHASVAAFARHVLELVALGAPAELIRAASQAQLDEIEHARLCFGLASAYAGRSIGPGTLSLAELGRELSPSRLQPLALARELFASGCLNETFAAIEAARAAELAEDPIVVELLERIADDEANHAALAWRTLAWLSSSHAEVAEWLRGQLGTLASSLDLELPEGSDELAVHGRLPERERVLVQRQAIATIVRPTLRVLLGRTRVPYSKSTCMPAAEP